MYLWIHDSPTKVSDIATYKHRQLNFLDTCSRVVHLGGDGSLFYDAGQGKATIWWQVMHICAQEHISEPVYSYQAL
jgi:hypothetical protein